MALRRRTDPTASPSPPSQTEPDAAPRRGAPLLDVARCTGDGACARVCPASAITLVPVVRGRLIWHIDYGACVFCARCQDVCPAGAIRMGEETLLAATDRADLIAAAEVAELRPRRPPAPGEWHRRER